MCKQLHAFFLMSLIGGTAIAGPVMLDDFDSDPNDGLFGARNFSSFIADDPFNQGGSTVIDTAFSYGSDTGAMIMNSGIGVQQEAELAYQLNSGPVDLADTGVLAFDFFAVDQDFSIRIVMIGGDGGKAVIDQLHVGAGGPQTVEFDILNDSDFVNMDISQIIDVRINFNTSFRVGDDYEHVPSLDFVLGSIRAVPAPSNMALLGLGGLAATRRRRG
ncbi:MAG: PEP-CTERM sorting domain-containing protein [Phycisphaerales bacterium JB047]